MMTKKNKNLDVRSLTPTQLKSIADFIRFSITSHDAISIERRVEIFSGKEAINVLLSPGGKKKVPLDTPISTPEQAKHLLLVLLSHGYFIKATINGTKELPLSPMQQAMLKAEAASGNSSSNNQTPKPEIIYLVSPDPSISWSDDVMFIWIYEGSKLYTTLISFGILIVAFCIIMYPLWPYTLKLGAWYLSIGCLLVLGLLVALSVIRFILYVLSLLIGLPGFWLFPNLFEDCGFFESFVPLYGWDKSWSSSTLGSKGNSSGSTNSSKPKQQ